jgi:hypothetical protein
VLTEEIPKQVNIIDKLRGKTNDSKIDFFIHKNKDAFEIKIPSYENYNFEGKGLVIAANGVRYRYITGVYMNVYVIRKLYKSQIPIEIMYVGEDEAFSKDMKQKLLDLGNIKLVDLAKRLNTNVVEKKLIGYRTKPLAVIASSFKEVVLMDADALSFIDPYYFFNLEGYISTGMLLFKDYVSCLRYINKDFINTIGIESEKYCNKTDGFELDSSCVVLDKERAWEALYAICIINVESESYYSNKTKNVLGDKDTWLIGSMFVNFEPHISEADPGLMLSPTEGSQKELRVVYGHLQSQKINNFGDFSGNRNVPLYYNNQAIDLTLFDGMDGWGYIEGGIKNPNMGSVWTERYIKINEQMKKTFSVASKGLKNIIQNVTPLKKYKRRQHKMVVSNLI